MQELRQIRRQHTGLPGTDPGETHDHTVPTTLLRHTDPLSRNHPHTPYPHPRPAKPQADHTACRALSYAMHGREAPVCQVTYRATHEEDILNMRVGNTSKF
ncbi:hypothetical protein GCM10023347_26520 [Streptomyces chumphonensis]